MSSTKLFCCWHCALSLILLTWPRLIDIRQRPCCAILRGDVRSLGEGASAEYVTTRFLRAWAGPSAVRDAKTFAIVSCIAAVIPGLDPFDTEMLKLRLHARHEALRLLDLLLHAQLVRSSQ